MNGRAVASPVKAYHLRGSCYDEYKAAEAARREAAESGIDGWTHSRTHEAPLRTGLARSNNRLGTFPGTCDSKTSPPGASCARIPASSSGKSGKEGDTQ